MLATLALMLVVRDAFSQGVSLTDFGYQSMRVQGKLPLGSRQLLIIRTDVAGDDNTTHEMSYYDNMVFNFFAYPSVNGFMLTNSNGRFSLSRAGVIDLIDYVDFTAEERNSLLANEVAKAGHSINAAARGGFDFAPFDTDGNNYITSDELLVLVVENHNTNDSGAARWAHPLGAGTQFLIEGTDTYFLGSICLVSQNVSFATLCHEISHVMGTVDLYGVWNQEALSQRLTIMSATITSPNNLETYQFDPWHKLRLGWCEPQMRDVTYGGVVTLAGSGSSAPDKQVILYDGARGTSEYFMLEYRAPVAGTYDNNASGTGLVIWHVEQDAAHNLVQRASPYINGATHATMWIESPPDLRRGGGQNGPPAGAGAWGSGAMTPRLVWNDGTFSDTTILVRPFVPGAESITVEILTARDTWVDFSYVPPPSENGTFASPYNTLSEGLGFAPWRGTIFFKPGHTTERGTINKALTLKAPLGAVTLGQ